MTVALRPGGRAYVFVTTMTGQHLAPVGICAVRALLGLVTAAGYVVDHRVRGELWGPSGVYPRDMARADQAAGDGFNLFLLSDSNTYFEALFHVGLLAAVCVTLGIGGRSALLVCWAVDWSLYRANPLILDGGGNLVHLVLPMLLLTDCGRHLRLGRPGGASKVDRWPRILAHNVGVLAVALQVCIVYVLSGTFKLQGDRWVDGTALYYILQVPEFYRPGPTDLLLGSDTALALAAYGATAMLVFFPVLVLHRDIRPWAVGGMVMFHVSIAVLMGLTTFALTMIACDLVFVDRHVRRITDLVRAVGLRARAVVARAGITRRPLDGDPAGRAVNR